MEDIKLIYGKSFGHKLALIGFAISILALLPFAYSSYVLIRLVFFIAVLWCGWQIYLGDQRIKNIHFVIAGLAILYNPLFLVHLGSKAIWLIINLCTSYFVLKISDALLAGEK